MLLFLYPSNYRAALTNKLDDFTTTTYHFYYHHIVLFLYPSNYCHTTN